MKVVLFVLLGLALLVGIVAGVGALVPVGHTASSSVHLEAPPEAVWKTLTQPGDFPAWRSGLKGVEILATEPLRWVEVDSHNERLTIEVTESEPPRRLKTTIADKSLPFGGSWVFELSPKNGGTDLTITEQGEIYSVFFRFMSRFVFGYTATMERYAEDLSRRTAP
jgi:uncharacterized protein YndB with AHSA1/START domain